MKPVSAKAFTLVELIVVITILAILATVGFLSLQGYTKDARNTATKANVRTVVESVANETAISTNSPTVYVGGVAANMANLGATNNVTVFNGITFSGTLSGSTMSGALVYSGAWVAGTVRYDSLRLDSLKFRDNGNAFLMGAATTSTTMNSKVRTLSAFQVAATIDEGVGSRALVEGTYGTGAVTDSAGLIMIGGVNTFITNGGTVVPYTY